MSLHTPRLEIDGATAVDGVLADGPALFVAGQSWRVISCQRGWIRPASMRTGSEELFEIAVGVKEGEDPVAVCPEIVGAVIDLGRGALGFVELPAQKIEVIPFGTALLEVVDKWSMGFAEFADAVGLILAELVQHAVAGFSIYMVPVEQKIVFEGSGKLRFYILKEVDLGGVVGEAGLADVLLDALPVVGDDLVALFGQGGIGCRAMGTGYGQVHFLMELEDSIFHGCEV